MPEPEGIKPGHVTTQEHNLEELRSEVSNMVSKLTKSLPLPQRSHLHKSGSSHHEDDQQDEEDKDHDGGIRIITLAGTNTGATMRGGFDEKSNIPQNGHSGVSPSDEHNPAKGTYINSNIQTINNSLMVGGKCSNNDPGVHVSIYEEFDDHHHDHKDHHHDHIPDKKDKKEKEKKKDKEKVSFKGDHSQSD